MSPQTTQQPKPKECMSEYNYWHDSVGNQLTTQQAYQQYRIRTIEAGKSRPYIDGGSY